MSFPPSAACKFLDLPPVNLRNLHLHLTKNPFVIVASAEAISPCSDKNQAAWECNAKVSKGRPQSPLVASAEAISSTTIKIKKNR